MLNDFTGADKVYIACGYTDLRKGMNLLTKWRINPFYGKITIGRDVA